MSTTLQSFSLFGVGFIFGVFVCQSSYKITETRAVPNTSNELSDDDSAGPSLEEMSAIYGIEFPTTQQAALTLLPKAHDLCLQARNEYERIEGITSNVAPYDLTEEARQEALKTWQVEARAAGWQATSLGDLYPRLRGLASVEAHSDWPPELSGCMGDSSTYHLNEYLSPDH